MFLLNMLLSGVTLARSDEFITVETKSGIVIGTRNYLNEIEYNRYLGIRYAEPPVGTLRFKYPQPVKPWWIPLLALTFPPACVQYYPPDYPWVDKQPGQSEDCLYLNIWTPKREVSKKAVMFWIHSGSYNTGSSRLPVYDGQVLATYGDVIVVTANYRVGIFGFLSADPKEAPGNMGLFDVLTALKWIVNNIEAFGGDRNRITLFGNGAGSVISGLCMVSPLAQGLFRRVIMQSEVPFPLTTARSHNDRLTKKTAEAVGCWGDVVECLRTKDAQYLAEKINSFGRYRMETFIPVSNDSFMPVDPAVALKSYETYKGVDILTGFVEDDGSIIPVTHYPEIFGPYGEMNPAINGTGARRMILEMLDNRPFKYPAANYYLSNVDEKDFGTIRKRVYHSVGDCITICPTVYLAERRHEESKTYVYYFRHQTPNTVFAAWMGVSYFMEVSFVFGRPIDQPHVYSPAEQELSYQMVLMWTSFAKTGVPSPEWKSYSRQNRYIQSFYINGADSSLAEHLKNCDFYRPYF